MSDISPTSRGRAAALLRQARAQAGLTQSQLAEVAHTTQSAIAAYEAGTREPTVPVLTRLLAATGSLLHMDIHPDPTRYRLTDVARDIASVDRDDVQRRLRLVLEFLRGAQEDGVPLMVLVAAEPQRTDDPRFDALLAAVAEDLCVHGGLTPPAWVHGADRFLNRAWWVSDLPSARASALVHAPASYRRRGVMLDRHDLVAA